MPAQAAAVARRSLGVPHPASHVPQSTASMHLGLVSDAEPLRQIRQPPVQGSQAGPGGNQGRCQQRDIDQAASLAIQFLSLDQVEYFAHGGLS